jgi:hypothetical protein
MSALEGDPFISTGKTFIELENVNFSEYVN